MKGKAKFKIVAGESVLICSQCSMIIKYARHFSDEEKIASKGELKIAPQLCDKCEEKKYK